jgi:hypothetical protein
MKCECEVVLARYGLEQFSMASSGADRQPEFPDWRVRISDGVAPIYLNVRIATLFEADLRRVRETGLADHGQVSASSDTLV